MGEGFKVLFILYLASGHATRVGIVDALLHFLSNTFFGQTAVKGVMDAHPVYREIALLAEPFVAESLLCEVAELDIERLVAHLLGDGLEHLAEKVFLSPFTLRIFTFAHHAAMHKEVGWEDRGAVTYNGEQLAQHTPRFIGTHNHMRLHPWGLRTHGEQLPAMEEIDIAHGWQFFQLAKDGRCDTFHAAKIQKKLKQCIFRPKKIVTLPKF